MIDYCANPKCTHTVLHPGLCPVCVRDCEVDALQPEEGTECCKICRFFKLDDLSYRKKRWQCRINPPFPGKGWPAVNANDWCGSFQKAES